MRNEHVYVLGKIDYNDSGQRDCLARITWTLENGRFSMCAEIWNPRRTDVYACGQCVDTIAAFFPHDKKAQRMLAIWRRWHLNDMRAGSPAQMAYLEAHPVDAVYPKSHYEEACRVLKAAGLNPDPDTGYRYGSAWLKEELPIEVIAEIESWDAPVAAEVTS